MREVLEDVEDILQRAGDEEVLLQQAKLLADLRFVVRIEHLVMVSEVTSSSTACQ